MAETNKKDLLTALPFWDTMTEQEQGELEKQAALRKLNKGEQIHRGDEECSGVLYVAKGQLRPYILSEEGREVTLYRLRQGETCVLSASCLMDAIVFDVLIEAVEETEVLMVPASALHQILERNPLVELQIYKLTSKRFSDVMWTMQQILFMGADQRVAHFLRDEMEKTGEQIIPMTHDAIARYIGSAREVVTKVLKYLAQEGVLTLSRGRITIVDKEKLENYL